MNKQRPVNLDLTTMKFPPMAIASILHRISGVVIFLLLPLLLYLLDQSLESAEHFANTVVFLQTTVGKLLMWTTLTAVIYHLLAGIRHLAMDYGYGETLKGGRNTAITVIALSAVLSVLAGVWLW